MSGARHVGLLGDARSIARDDWGLNWNVALEQGGWLVGKEIKLEIAIAADEVAAADASRAGRQRLLAAPDRGRSEDRPSRPINSASPPRERRPGSGRGVRLSGVAFGVDRAPGRPCHHRRR